MKKILFLIHDLSYGGAEKVLVNLVNNLDKTKFDVTVQTLFDVGANKQYLKSDVNYIGGMKKMFRGNSTLMKFFSPKTLCKLVIKDDYDIVVSYLEGPPSRIASAYDGKNVAWLHCMHKNKEHISNSFRSIKETADCYNSFDKIICVAKTVKDNFTSLLDIKTSVDVLYNTNESQEIINKSQEKPDDLTLNKNETNIVSVGKLADIKGYDRLLEIHKKLLDDGIKNHVYILGVGGDKDKLETRAREFGVEDSFTLLGFRDNPYKYVSKMDLYVCSSRSEGFSTAVTESLIVGTPVVSTNCSGAYELLGENDEYGIVTENDENSLYLGVKKMLTEKDLLDFYTKQAQIRGKAFSTENTTKAVENMLLNL